MEKGKKRRGKREIGIKKEGNYLYFISMFNIGPYDRKKVPKNREEFLKISGGKIFWVAIIYYTPGLHSIYFLNQNH